MVVQNQIGLVRDCKVGRDSSCDKFSNGVVAHSISDLYFFDSKLYIVLLVQLVSFEGCQLCRLDFILLLLILGEY